MKFVSAAIVFLIFPTCLNAESQTPMRSIMDVVITKATMAEAQACVTRDIAHNGRVVVVPVTNGVEIDELTQTFLTKPTDPRFRVRVTDSGEDRKIEAFYRHPFSAKLAALRLDKMKRNCGL